MLTLSNHKQTNGLQTANRSDTSVSRWRGSTNTALTPLFRAVITLFESSSINSVDPRVIRSALIWLNSSAADAKCVYCVNQKPNSNYHTFCISCFARMWINYLFAGHSSFSMIFPGSVFATNRDLCIVLRKCFFQHFSNHGDLWREGDNGDINASCDGQRNQSKE